MSKKKYLYIVGGFLGILGLSTALASTGCEDPQGNSASFESVTIAPDLLPFSEGLTFTQVKKEDGSIATLLVVEYDGEDVRAIDVASLGSSGGEDIFDAISELEWSDLQSATARTDLQNLYQMEQLLPAAGSGNRHVATGTNFPEHASETTSTSVFNFPKFGLATPPRTSIRYDPDILLDYEVEICSRFDRNIGSVEDFDTARKGFFLCGDFTDRATLMRLIDTSNFDSGNGFSDAKSGIGFYPSGPFLVVPNDWRAFVKDERMTTFVNGEPRQDARGGEMMLDFRQISEKILKDTKQRFLYRDERHTLMPKNFLEAGMSLMSGTSEGVIFTPPTRCDIAAGVRSNISSGDLFRGRPVFESVVETFIEREMQSGHFLQAGDVVDYESSTMGTIKIIVTQPGTSDAP